MITCQSHAVMTGILTHILQTECLCSQAQVLMIGPHGGSLRNLELNEVLWEGPL